MSAENLINTMEKLLKLHQSLLELSTKKTDIVIKGDMDALKQILKDEQAHIAAIGKFESERQKITEAILPDMDKPSVSDCIDVVDGTKKDILSHLRMELLETISKIKDKNELNQQMIHQSLQFVNLSLSLVFPQPENFNYGPSADKPNTSALFNSKA